MPTNGSSNDLSELLNKLVCKGALEQTPFLPHPTATSQRYEGICCPENSKTWTVCDTEIALGGVPFDVFMGLKFYHTDPLPFLLRYIQKGTKQSKLFIDHEFPSTPSASVSVDTCTPRGTIHNMLPGVIATSNCHDFASVDGRQKRIQQYCKIAKFSSWQRSQDTTAPLFKALEADNIQQGKIGNCGFCSAFASLVQGWPQFMQQAFGPYSEAALMQCGAYSLKVFPRGQERYLLLDDHLLRNEKGNKAPSMQSRRGDTWVEYLEKAIAKVQGSYASLDGHYKHNSLYRHPARALQLLTGAPIAMEVHYNVQSRKNSVQDVYKVLAATQSRYARVAHCRENHQNLVSNHGYSLLWVGSTTDGQQLACLRNPHGRCSYRGKYGHGWNWKKNDRHVLQEFKKLEFFRRTPCLGCPVTGQDNGIFLMEFDVFARCFPTVTIVGPIGSTNPTCQPLDSAQAPEFIYKSKPVSLAGVKALLEVANKC